jgi:hypothetical protein
MTTWPHEWLFRRPSREDCRCRRTWELQDPGGPDLRREPLLGQALRKEGRPRRISRAPKKSPGSAPKLDEKATKLLKADLKQRPFATLQERSDYIHVLTGIWVSRSTICRAIARIGASRKKGDDPQRSATSSEEPPGG